MPVEANVKKTALENALYNLMKLDAFYGRMLQEINIKYNFNVPTAAMTYNKLNDSFEMWLNEDFFCPLTPEQRTAILSHEILHFSHQHLFRIFGEAFPQETQQMRNVAADMAINQYIKDLPPGGVDVNNFKLADGKPFPLFKTAEEYYSLLADEQNQKANQKQMEAYGAGKNNDVHIWDSLSEEEKQKMLEEAKKLIKRTIDKTNRSHSSVPDSIKDLLEEIENALQGLDHKGILKRAIKRTISALDRESTWTKPNKRYGVYCPGTRVGKVPNIAFLMDTSGSMSHREINAGLDVCDGFLRVGSKTCTIGMWHTSLYSVKRYKIGNRVKQAECLQSGGTDIREAMEFVKKTNPNLAIIFTDGYFDKCDVKIHSEVIWVISEGGNKEHPMKHLGKTIFLDNLIGKKKK